jgi:tetratricopeptide (TPR) repeat protein
MRGCAALARISALLAAGALAACAPPPAPAPPRAPIPAEVAPWLLPPIEAGSPGRASGLHLRLLSSGDADAVAREAESLLAADAAQPGVQTVLAQARLARGDAAGALDAARAAGVPGGAPALAVAARALESQGSLVEAFEAYSELASGVPAAAAAAVRLEPRAVELLEARTRAALARGELAAADSAFSRLESLRPNDPAVQELGLDLAAARGDLPRELALVRSLSANQPERVELQERRARLEMEVGDPRVGLDLYQALADASPGDLGRQDELRRATFRWRVLNAPEAVRRAAAHPEVTRADLAVLLYWLVPQVRTAGTGAPRIAADVLEHRAREEIVRVVNLGLLGVDEALHVFEPERPARRSELFRALQLLLGPGGCAGPAGAAGASRDAVCEGARDCGLIASAGDCLAGAAISGREALEALRRTLVVLEGP